MNSKFLTQQILDRFKVSQARIQRDACRKEFRSLRHGALTDIVLAKADPTSEITLTFAWIAEAHGSHVALEWTPAPQQTLSFSIVELRNWEGTAEGGIRIFIPLTSEIITIYPPGCIRLDPALVKAHGK